MADRVTVNQLVGLARAEGYTVAEEDSVGARQNPLRLIKASDVAMRDVEFAWHNRIVRGALNLNVGDEDAGKGLMDCWLAAEITTGRMLSRPVTVAYISTEEDIETTVRPRLVAAGADLDIVWLLPMGSIGLPDCLPDLSAEMDAQGVEVMFLDPINGHFSPGHNVNHAQDVALVLGQVQKMAAESRITVIGNLHTSRRGGSVNARDNYAHQLEFRRVCRSSFIIGRTPDDGVDERTIVHDKANYSAKGPALKARIEGVEVSGLKNPVGRLLVTGESDAAVEDVFIAKADQAQGIERAKQERTQVQACADAILRERTRLGNPPIADVGAFSKVTAGYANSTVGRARQKLGITTEPVHDDQGRIAGHLWRFPS